MSHDIGNYRIVCELARGAFGQVYLAQHIYLDKRFVAIKLLHRASFNSQEEMESFLQEARILSTIQHRYILPFIDFGVHDGFPYLVTAYAPNGSLKERLQRTAPHLLSIEDSLNVLSQIGEALHYAHQHNIVHRDLKPGNILFGAEGDALLADFGLATTLETASLKRISNDGTPRYMAPEQFKGHVSKEGDQYALGIIAYELFTGRVPFYDANFFVLGMKHVEEAPLPPRRLNPQIPIHVEEAILKALAKERTARYGSIPDFVKALRAFPVYDKQPATDLQKRMPPPLSVDIDTGGGQNGSPSYPMLEASRSPFIPVSEAGLSSSNSLPCPAQSDPSTGGGTTLSIRRGPPIPAHATGSASSNHMGYLFHTQPAQPSHITQRMQRRSASAGKNAEPTKLRALLASSIIFLILLLTLGGTLYSTGVLDSIASGTNGTGAEHNPTIATAMPAATTALITITPQNTHFTQNYTITEVTDNPDATQNQVAGVRIITSISSRSSTQAIGQRQTQGTRATGTLRLFQPSQVVIIPAGTEFSGGGVTVATGYTVSLRPGGSVTVSAYALQSGSGGNIAAYTINTVSSLKEITFSVQNPGAFSGGSDRQSYQVLQQSDIDRAAQSLTEQATQAAQDALDIQRQANEALIGEKHCSSQTRAHPPAGAPASRVTVTVQTICRVRVYDPQPALAMAATLLKQDLPKKLGPNYILVGSTYATVTDTALAGPTVSISINAEAVAVFQFTDTQLKNIASLLTNRDEQSAETFLSHKAGILAFTINLTGGDEQTFPRDADKIIIQVEQVRGL